MNENNESPDKVIISWSCGCSIVQDSTGRQYDQPGIFCNVEGRHRAKVVKTSPEGERYREGGGLFDA